MPNKNHRTNMFWMFFLYLRARVFNASILPL